MNATEQRQRHTAVSAVERRLDDVETVVMGLSQQIVDDRIGRDRQIKELVDSVNATLSDGHERQRVYIDEHD